MSGTLDKSAYPLNPTAAYLGGQEELQERISGSGVTPAVPHDYILTYPTRFVF